MTEKITIYDMDIEEERFERVKGHIMDLNPTGNYGKKAIGKKAIQLADYLLEEEIEEADRNIAEAERKIDNLREVVKGY